MPFSYESEAGAHAGDIQAGLAAHFQHTSSPTSIPWPTPDYHHGHYVHAFPSRPLELLTPVFHQVFLIRCKQCDTFFSNRGMKAVLLLRPGLPLYSTDAIPANCSPITYQGEDETPETVMRTCDCLTQTLYCHGCGTNVGYMIVSPCARCTASGSGTSDRSANSHRFVFHSADVVAVARQRMQHLDNEKTPRQATCASVAHWHHAIYQIPVTHESFMVPFTPEMPPPPRLHPATPDSLPPLEPASFPVSVEFPLARPTTLSRLASQADPPQPRSLFWHQLGRGGEVSPIIDDARHTF